MKLIFYCFLLLLSVVLGSEFKTETENVQDQEPETKVEEFQFDLEDPEFIKHTFMNSIKNANVAESKVFAEKYEYLTDKFNRDIFSELIKCFEAGDNEETCWELYEILKPSFLDVSRSTTTPLILAVRRNRMELVNALLKMEGINEIIDNVDEFDRTALMYAAKRGSYFAVKMILQVSSESINVKDFMGKTAIHYACEMIPLVNDENTATKLPDFLTGAVDQDVKNKASIVAMLMVYGGMIYPESPEYKLTPADVEVNELITDFSGRVLIENDSRQIVKRLGQGLALTQGLMLLNMSGKMSIIAARLVNIFLSNPFMNLLNNLCYHLMQVLLPGIDSNLVFSVDVEDGFQDFSFNLLFVILMIPTLKYAVESYLNNTKEVKF